jgi:tRNA pseudouridine13 synthase
MRPLRQLKLNFTVTLAERQQRRSIHTMADTTTDAVHATTPALESSAVAPNQTAQDAPSLISITDAAAAAQAEQERAVGITKYVSPDAPGFSCIVKQRYTDFLVNEIRPTGEVLHLTEIAEPAKKLSREQKRANANVEGGAEANGDAGRKRQAEDGQGEQPAEGGANKRQKVEPQAAPSQADVAAAKKAAVASVTEEDCNTLNEIFGEPTTQKIVKLYGDVVALPHRKPRDHDAVQSEIISDKSKRTQAHIAVRKIFQSKLETLTMQDKPGTISIRAAPKGNESNGRRTDGTENGDGAKQKGKIQWDDLGGEHLHFTLYKENKDTMEVLFFMATQLKTKVSNFQFAGTKDRRGVTVQKISISRVRKEQIIGMTKSARGWKVGGFEYKKHGLELGELLGNEFLLTLRDCHAPNEEGLNHEQRFEALQKAVSQAAKDFGESGFINYYGLQRFGTFSTGTHTTGMKILQGDLEGAVNGVLSYPESSLPANQDPSVESKIPQDDIDRAEAIRIWNETGNSRKAMDILPRRFQAETSMIQYLGKRGKNKELVQNKDWQGALASIQRNLRLMYVHAYQSMIWNMVAGKRREVYGDQPVEGDLVIVGEKDEPKAETNEVEVDQDGEPVVRPSGDDSSAPEDPYTRARPLSKEEAESGKFNIFDIVLPLPGWDVEYPKNSIGKFYEELMGSELGGGLDPHKMRRNWKDASLSGSYRRMMSKPGGLQVEVKTCSDENEQLVETDAEKLLKQSGQTQETEEKKPEAKGDKLAVVLKMQLGSSQYATMALRELTKGRALAYTPEFSAAR